MRTLVVKLAPGHRVSLAAPDLIDAYEHLVAEDKEKYGMALLRSACVDLGATAGRQAERTVSLLELDGVCIGAVLPRAMLRLPSTTVATTGSELRCEGPHPIAVHGMWLSAQDAAAYEDQRGWDFLMANTEPINHLVVGSAAKLGAKEAPARSLCGSGCGHAHEGHGGHHAAAAGSPARHSSVKKSPRKASPRKTREESTAERAWVTEQDQSASKCSPSIMTTASPAKKAKKKATPGSDEWIDTMKAILADGGTYCSAGDEMGDEIVADVEDLKRARRGKEAASARSARKSSAKKGSGCNMR